jgi:hypothetical protein
MQVGLKLSNILLDNGGLNETIETHMTRFIEIDTFGGSQVMKISISDVQVANTKVSKSMLDIPVVIVKPTLDLTL